MEPIDKPTVYQNQSVPSLTQPLIDTRTVTSTQLKLIAGHLTEETPRAFVKLKMLVVTPTVMDALDFIVTPSECW